MNRGEKAGHPLRVAVIQQNCKIKDTSIKLRAKKFKPSMYGRAGDPRKFWKKQTFFFFSFLIKIPPENKPLLKSVPILLIPSKRRCLCSTKT